MNERCVCAPVHLHHQDSTIMHEALYLYFTLLHSYSRAGINSELIQSIYDEPIQY